MTGLPVSAGQVGAATQSDLPLDVPFPSCCFIFWLLCSSVISWSAGPSDWSAGSAGQAVQCDTAEADGGGAADSEGGSRQVCLALEA